MGAKDTNKKDDTGRSNKAQNRKKNIKLHRNVAEASWFPSNSWQVSKDDVPDAPPMYKMVMACSFQVRNKKEEIRFKFKLSCPSYRFFASPLPSQISWKSRLDIFLAL